MSARFFLGLAEAGLFPGVNYFLSSWYKRNEIGVRIVSDLNCCHSYRTNSARPSSSQLLQSLDLSAAFLLQPLRR